MIGNILQALKMNTQEVLLKIRESGLSDAEIADKIGIKASSVYRLRLGINKNPNPSTCRGIANTFGYLLKYESGVPKFYPKQNNDMFLSGGEREMLDYLSSIGIRTKEDCQALLRSIEGQCDKIKNSIIALFNSEKRLGN